MSIEKAAINIPELLAVNEETISQHYQIYADTLKEFKEFWSSIIPIAVPDLRIHPLLFIPLL